MSDVKDLNSAAEARLKHIHNKGVETASDMLKTLSATVFGTCFILPLFQWVMEGMPINLEPAIVVYTVACIIISLLIGILLYYRAITILEELK